MVGTTVDASLQTDLVVQAFKALESVFCVASVMDVLGRAMNAQDMRQVTRYLLGYSSNNR